MNKDCKGKHHNCGEFEGNETKEEKLKHLKECKENLLKKIEKIDKAIAELD
ncbi:MAG: hypothetical protein ACTSQF_10415 [Candidatus Heimdallarchaeaceae archaeon]